LPINERRRPLRSRYAYYIDAWVRARKDGRIELMCPKRNRFASPLVDDTP
jgi:hypothetical protein